MPRFGRAALAAAAGALLSTGVLAGLIVAPDAANAATTSYHCEIPAPGTEPYLCWIHEPAVIKPLSLKLQIVSTPDKRPVYYDWTVICDFDGTQHVQSDIENQIAPISLQLPLPVAEPDTCQVNILVEQIYDNTDYTATLTAITAASPSPSPTPSASPVPQVVRGFGGKCIGTPSTAKRAKVEIRTCSATSPAETWKYHGGELIHNKMCANAQASAVKGSKIILWPCNGSANEIWTRKSTGEYVLKAGHGKLCLDDPRSSTANGTQLVVYTCTNSRNQHWTLPGR